METTPSSKKFSSRKELKLYSAFWKPVEGYKWIY
ncbi:hypothetical protein LEP1GSC074_3970, partial [Leptospira noguchii str. Hook]